MKENIEIPNNSENPKRFFRRKEVAKILGVHPGTIKKWGKDPSIPLSEIVINSRVVRYDPDEVYAMANNALI